MKRGILILTIVSAPIFVQAQAYAFKVLANSGLNQIKSNDVWQPVKTGDQLKIGDEIMVSQNSYVGLIHANGRPMELKESKTYKVSDLISRTDKSISLVSKYTDLILSNNTREAKNRVATTGTAHRSQDEIQVFLPGNQFADIYNSIIIINWKSERVSKSYVVTIKNMFDEELMKIETSETSLQLDKNNPKLVKDDALLVDIKFKGDDKYRSRQYLIKKLSSVRQKSIKKLISEMCNDIKEETAINSFVMAGFYEENKLFIDAIAAYEQAIRLAPEVQAYKEAYEEFLLRIN